MKIDEYQSAVCARLESLEIDVHSPTRSKKKRRSGRPNTFSFTVSDDEPLVSYVFQGVKPRKQINVAIRGISKTVSWTRGVSSRMSPSGRNRVVRRSKTKKPMRSSAGRESLVCSHLVNRQVLLRRDCFSC